VETPTGWECGKCGAELGDYPCEHCGSLDVTAQTLMGRVDVLDTGDKRLGLSEV
jgi:hypothetical protein